MKLFLPKLIFAAALWLIPASAFGAAVSFEPASLVANQAKPFAATVVLNTEGQSINAIDGTVLIAPELGNDITVSDSGSVVTYWVERPEWNPGTRTVTFSGTIPGGYNGQAGILFTLIFPARNGEPVENAAVIMQVNSYLNDGLGTPARIIGSQFSLVSDGSANANPEITEQLYLDTSKADNVPPEVFSPQLARDDSMFEGRWFISFSTTDKQSGISHYEIQETRSGRLHASRWQRAESPYLLQDQELHSFIYVVAIDRQGNERMIKVYPRKPLDWWQKYSRDLAIGGGLIVLIAVGIVTMRRKRTSTK